MPHSATITLAADLIKRPSVTPDDADCQRVIIQRLEAAGFSCEPMRFGDVDNLWATRGSGSPLIVFAGHTDVVPTGDLGSWTHPPFGAVIEDGFLHGRGAADMKGSLAAMVTAVERFVQQYPNHGGRIGFLLTSDEEGPAVDGTVKVVAALLKKDIHIDYCIVGEPTSTKTVGDIVKNGRRGSLNGLLTVQGKQGHVAYPHLADNPIHTMAAALQALCQEHWDDGNEFFPPTTFQISNVQSGTGASNVIPDTAQAWFNFRFSPESSPDSLKAKTKDIIDRCGATSKIDWTLSGMPFQTNPGVLIDTVTASIKSVTGVQTELSTTGGTSDARFIAPTGTDVIELGPVNATIHKVDECISIQDLDQLSLIYEKVLERTLTTEK